MSSCRHATAPGAMLALSVLILALAPPAPSRAADTVGLWFDVDFSVNESGSATFPYTGTAYLVLREPSGPNVGGWECRVTTDGPALWLGWTLAGQAVNFDTPPSFTVGLGSPLPGDVDYLLASADYVVTGPGPVAFGLVPTQHPSLPDRMAYIIFDDPKPLVPMTTATGVPEVAWHNREMPVCTLSTDMIDFGERPVGVETTARLTIANDGGGTLYLAPQLGGACDAFRLVAGGDPAAVPPGATRNITVGFLPTALGEHACELSLGTDCDPVPLIGSGREPIVSGTVSPNPLDFGTVVETTTARRTAVVTNTGEVAFSITFQPQPGCAEFVVVGPLSFDLLPGGQMAFAIDFTPPASGNFACEILLNEVIPPLQLTGAGRAANVLWDVSPSSVDFGSVGLNGGEIERAVVVGNLGDLPQALELSLADPDSLFRIVSPVDPQPVVDPGGYLAVNVGFTPSVPGPHTATLVLGGGAPDVPLAAFVEDPSPDCRVGATLVDFGVVNVGGSVARTVRVENVGNTTLEVAPTTSCPEFVVTSGPTVVAPGRYTYVSVAYRPTDVGTDQCTLDLGPDACVDVTLLGEGRSTTGDGFDLVALSFVPDYIEPEIWTPVAPVVAYLMFVNPSHDAGVYGWELKIDLDPQVFLISTVIRGGQSINFLTPPEFLVALASPLPPASTIVLADLTLLPVDTWPHALGVGPVHVPSIPGAMAWAYNDNYDLSPMYSITGQPEVAWINPDGGVAVLAPTPLANLTGNLVELRWPLPSEGDEGCHLYRTVGGQETRLTSAPLQPVAGGYVYVDDTSGLQPGTTVTYAYGVLRGGAEIARSPGVDVELPGAGALVTRLLPNRPNPFNPETEIPFTIARPGRVRIAVYDLTGRRVAQLLDETRAAGGGQVFWRGRDDAGRTVPSGAYYVILDAGDARDTRKVMLVK